jgi:MioC protein
MTTAEQTSEEILVLFGSQTGNSEAAAHEICSTISARLLPASSRLTSRVMHLDDFLEVEGAGWTRLVVIVCSSYGVGQAPIGARKFREFCDEILKRREGKEEGSTPSLGGVTFALLGLGDSHYSTYFRNPTIIHDALTAAGATRVGELGKADASGTGEMEQSKVIERWIEGIWDDLAKVLASDPPERQVLDRARDETWGICLEIFPDWKPKKKFSAISALYLPLVGIVLALLAHYCVSQI